MKEPTYRQTLIYAWHAVWENKILWILGLLSVFLGQLGFSDVLGKIWSIVDASLGANGLTLIPLLELDISGGIWSMFGIVWLAVICLSLLALLIFLAVTSQGSVIAYAANWFKTGKHSPVVKPWQKSVKHFWSILFVNIIRQVVMFVLLLGFVYGANHFFDSRTVGQGFAFALVSVLVLIVSLLISCLSVYTLCYVILDGKGLAASFKKAWRLFAEHVLVSIEVGVLLMLLNFFLVLLLVAGSFFAFLPALLIWVAGGITNLVILATVGLVVGIVLLLLFIALVAGFFNAFTISAWVFLFMKMHKEGLASRTIHFFRYMFSR